MRNFLIAVVLVGLLAAPSLAASWLDIKVEPGSSVIDLGEQTVVTLMVRNRVPGEGVYGLQGSVIPTVLDGTPPVLANVGGLTFDPAYQAAPPSFSSEVGTPGNGGVADFGSARTGLTVDEHGQTWVPFATYTVKGVNQGVVNLWFEYEFDDPIVQVVPSPDAANVYSVGATITVVPEPATLAMLALGGLLIARRRRA